MFRVELRDLEYFLACVDEKSVTRAARRVHVAQPTLSHALARLEAEVGERLLDRGSRAMLRPTDAGRVLEVHARAALASVRAIPEGLAALRGLLSGTLRIASIQTLNATLLPRVLAEFARRHPGVGVRVLTCPTGELAEVVRDGRADVGLVAGMPVRESAGLSASPLYDEEFVAVVRADDPLARRRRVPLADLRDRPMLLGEPSTYTFEVVVEACRRAGFTPHVILCLDSGEGLRETVRAGLGLTLLPKSYVPRADRALRAVTLLEAPRRQVQLLRGTTRSRPADAFAEAVHATCRSGAT
jgi:DNA-binding transcriptional LysR family regulator